jgi:hypothetical protein
MMIERMKVTSLCRARYVRQKKWLLSSGIAAALFARH